MTSVNFHLVTDGACKATEVSVSVTGKPGKYSALVLDDNRDTDTAYSSPMSRDVTTTDPLRLAHAALSEYLAWRAAA